MSQVKLGWIQGQQTKWSIVEIEDFFNKDLSYITDIKPNHILIGSNLTDYLGLRIFEGDRLLSPNGKIHTILYNREDFQFYVDSIHDELCIINQQIIMFNQLQIIR